LEIPSWPEHSGRTRFGVEFVIHQVFAWWVTTVSAPVITASAVNLLHLAGWHEYRPAYEWILHGNPYFPAQACVGLLLGWTICGSLPDRSAMWVWVLPAAVLAYAVIAIPTLAPAAVPVRFQAGIGQARLAHYFGWGCASGAYCIDQSVFTRPFLGTAAYAIGAALELKTSARFRRNSQISWAFPLSVGIVFAAAASWDISFALRVYGWHWFYLTTEGVPLATGLLLLMSAVYRRLSRDALNGSRLGAALTRISGAHVPESRPKPPNTGR
jgi:hypothetical protein